MIFFTISPVLVGVRAIRFWCACVSVCVLACLSDCVRIGAAIRSGVCSGACSGVRPCVCRSLGPPFVSPSAIHPAARAVFQAFFKKRKTGGVGAGSMPGPHTILAPHPTIFLGNGVWVRLPIHLCICAFIYVSMYFSAIFYTGE